MQQAADTFRFHEFDIPVQLLNMTGGGIDTFDIISRMHIDNLRRFIGIHHDDAFLEIGCGIGRDAIPLTKLLSHSSSYTGIDIIAPSIDFCVTNISARYPHFRFVHLDVQDQLHNALGTTQMVDHDISLPDASIDKVIAWSVFTHMWEHDIRHYLKEFYRIMKPGAAAYLTCFVLAPDIVEKVRSIETKFNLRFEHQIDDGCFINDPVHPLGAIGYTAERWQDMVRDAGFEFKREFVRGAWSGFYADPEDGQDALVLVKPI